MSLIVWLPLMGDLQNKGASILQFTNINATIGSGKIGPCYYFNGIDARIAATSTISLSFPLSIACWIKGETITNSETEYIFSYNTNTGGSAGHNIAIGTLNGKLTIWHGGTTNSYDTNLANGTWYHIAATVTESEYKLYLNGQLVVSGTKTHSNVNSAWITLGARSNSSTGATDAASYYFKGYINDARLYNHCLSAAEVHKISQGLILHYKLDSINTITDSSGYGRTGILNDTTATLSTNTARYAGAITNSQAANSSTYLIKGECNIPASNTLTFAWWMKPIQWGTNTSGIFCTSDSNSTEDYNTTTMHMHDEYFYCCNTNNSLASLNVSASITLNEWHHYALVYNGSSLIFYKDGQQISSINQTGILMGSTYIFLFYSYASGVHRCMSGSISDFRIYCTALSINDIKSLITVNAKIDKTHKLHTYEIIENTNSQRPQLKATGQFITKSFSESAYAKIYKSGLIEADEIIEI